MDTKNYDKLSKELLAQAHAIQTSKRPGYTQGNSDVLKNFKAVGERIGVSPGHAWAVYFLKHIDAITTAMTKPDLPVSEEMSGRFCDAINYLQLGWALYVEERDGEKR